MNRHSLRGMVYARLVFRQSPEAARPTNNQTKIASYGTRPRYAYRSGRATHTGHSACMGFHHQLKTLMASAWIKYPETKGDEYGGRCRLDRETRRSERLLQSTLATPNENHAVVSKLVFDPSKELQGMKLVAASGAAEPEKISQYFTDPNLYRFESFTLKACSELDKDLEKRLAEAASEYEWDYFDSKSRYESSFEWPEYVYCLSGLDYYDGTVVDLWRQAEHAGLNACEFEHFYLGAALEVHDEEGTPNALQTVSLRNMIEDQARYDQALSQKSLDEIIVMNRQFTSIAATGSPKGGESCTPPGPSRIWLRNPSPISSAGEPEVSDSMDWHAPGANPRAVLHLNSGRCARMGRTMPKRL